LSGPGGRIELAKREHQALVADPARQPDIEVANVGDAADRTLLQVDDREVHLAVDGHRDGKEAAVRRQPDGSTRPDYLATIGADRRTGCRSGATKRV